MSAPARLGLYGLVLVVVFGAAFATAGAVVPETVVQNWTEEATDEHAAEQETEAGAHEGEADDAVSSGLGVAENGYQLTGLTAATETDTEGELSLAITGPDGKPVTSFDVDHEKELHLIVVRADGEYFRHAHPKMNSDGVWSLPWVWGEPGSYRVFVDFVPSDTGTGITLSSSVEVAGNYIPVTSGEQLTVTTVDGFEVSLDGDLAVGERSDLKWTVTRNDQPITSLEPYLGAYGHVVALREGDLAYLHVHPQGEEPQAGETSGPEIVFEASAPTPGRYLLYLDFKVDGQVRTAALVVDATSGSGAWQGGGENSRNKGEKANKDEEEGGS